MNKVLRYTGLALAAVGLVALGLNLGVWVVHGLSGEFKWLDLNQSSSSGYQAYVTSWFYHQWPYYHIIAGGAIVGMVGLGLAMIGKEKKA